MPIFTASVVSIEAVSATLKSHLQTMPSGTLPLHLCTSQGGIVDDRDISVSVLRTTESATACESKIAVFFDEIVNGCSCSDDGEQALNAHGELLVTIDKQSCEMTFTVLETD